MMDVPPTLFEFLQENVLRNESWPEPCVPSGHINCDMEEEEERKVEILRIRDPVEMRKQIGGKLNNNDISSLSFGALYKVTTCCVSRKLGPD